MRVAIGWSTGIEKSLSSVEAPSLFALSGPSCCSQLGAGTHAGTRGAHSASRFRPHGRGLVICASSNLNDSDDKVLSEISCVTNACRQRIFPTHVISFGTCTSASARPLVGVGRFFYVGASRLPLAVGSSSRTEGGRLEGRSCYSDRQTDGIKTLRHDLSPVGTTLCVCADRSRRLLPLVGGLLPTSQRIRTPPGSCEVTGEWLRCCFARFVSRTGA
jgi:hypothetical protein